MKLYHIFSDRKLHMGIMRGLLGLPPDAYFIDNDYATSNVVPHRPSPSLRASSLLVTQACWAGFLDGPGRL
jgi:hypothetical protein